MTLEIQIKSLLFSFLFGIYFAYIIKINYKFILPLNKFFRVVGTLLLIISNVLIYFFILLKINYGLLHIYLILMIILGVYIEQLLNKLIVKYIKKWYNLFKVGDNVKKRVTKASKKRLAVFGTLSVFIIGYFIFMVAIYIYNIGSLTIKKENLNNNLTELKREEKILNNEIEKLQDPAYIAKYAREHYAYSKDGEYIIKINGEKQQQENEKKFDININFKYVIYGSILLLLLIIFIIKKKK